MMKGFLLAGATIAVLGLAAGFLLLGRQEGGTVADASRDDTGAVQAQSAASGREPVGQTVEVVSVTQRQLVRTVRLPGELQPYLRVDLYPKVTGILEWIGVDRGSTVTQGEVLVRLVAPELRAQRAEAEAKLRADQLTYQRLNTAAQTPGVVAPNDLQVAHRTVQADQARVQALKEMEEYLTITAPFEAVVTERYVHPGALVGPGGGPTGNRPLLRLEQTARLRLVVPVPEVYAGSIVEGETVTFTVPAYPGETFAGIIRRIARSVDVQTRTMPVEMDVDNPHGRLAPGMFPEVDWPVRRPQPSLFVPPSAVVTTTERSFVLRVREDRVEWVDVKRGESMEEWVEVFGHLAAEDLIIRRGTDEIRPGSRVVPLVASDRVSSQGTSPVRANIANSPRARFISRKP